MPKLEIELQNEDYVRFTKIKQLLGVATDAEVVVRALQSIELDIRVRSARQKDKKPYAFIYESDGIPFLHYMDPDPLEPGSAPQTFPEIEPGRANVLPKFSYGLWPKGGEQGG